MANRSPHKRDRRIAVQRCIWVGEETELLVRMEWVLDLGLVLTV